MKNRPILFIILGWSWLLTIYVYDTNDAYGQELTERDNDPDDTTVDSIDGPLKIKLVLEQDEEYPEAYRVTDHAFDFKGLKQEPRNYALQQGNEFMDVSIYPDTFNFAYMRPLEIVNTTGTVTEKDIQQVSGQITIDKTLADSATGNITHVLGYGMVTIGDLQWMDVTGDITKVGNEAIVRLIDRPSRP